MIYTLRNKGPERVLPDRLRVYPQPFVSEEPVFKESVQELLEALMLPSDVYMFTHVSNGIFKCRYTWIPLIN